MEGFKATYSVDQETHRRVTHMTFDGAPCASFPLSGKVAKRYIGFCLIQADLEDALGWIETAYSLSDSRTGSVEPGTRLITVPDDASRACKAVFYSSIITYGKCFMNAEDREQKGRGRLTTLSREDHVDDAFLPCHDRIMGYRNQLVAHAVDPTDDGEIIVAIHPTHDAFHLHSNLTRLNFEDDRKPDPDGTTSPSFSQLIEHVLEKVAVRMKEIEERMLSSNGEAAQAVADYFTACKERGVPARPIV